MSAILGMISKKDSISDSVIGMMKNSMKVFKIDNYQEVMQGTVYFACGRQYITKEDSTDNLPLYDEKRQIMFTADCVLSNRNELITELSEVCSQEELRAAGDGQLSYKAYLHWGETFVEHLRGSFSFAVYRMEESELLLYADHFARRYLAYYMDLDKICFSTAYQPILAVLGDGTYKLNRKWIVSAYTDCSADVIKLHGETVYENIFHVEPGQYIKIRGNENRVEKHTYWNPLQTVQKLSGKTDEEYREIFLTTFKNAVKGLLRTNGEVGIMLSGGLDSSSVAAFAALELKPKNKKLYSYTAVPASEYSYRNTALNIENETAFIVAQQEMHSNLCPRFVSADDKNCFTDIMSHAAFYRKPVKPIINMVNIDAMMKGAASDKCKIMMSGQNGNATISYGRITTYLYQKLGALRFREAYREFLCFCKKHRVSKKYFMKVYFKTFLEEKVKPYKFGEDCFLKQEDIQKNRLKKQERKIVKSRGTGSMDSERQRKGFCFMPLVYQHMGFYDTYNSLRYGILSVDPTLTKEMVELCMSMPIDCFVRGGKERRAVRDYMKGYVPDVILDNYAGRGVQAADYAFRVNRDWDNIKSDVESLLSNPSLLEYIDKKKLQQLMHEIKESEYRLDKTLTAEAVVMASLSAFLDINNG